MKNSELWGQYKQYTEDLTTNSRKLAFIAGGLCWFFKDDKGVFPVLILITLLLLVLYFAFDLLQYFTAALFYRQWIRAAETERYNNTGTLDGDYEKPAWLDRPAFTCWCVKTIILLIIYGCLGWHIISTSLSAKS